MAELLMATGLAEADSLGARLRDLLPYDYMVVAEAPVQGRTLEAVVVGPQGLFVARSKPWEGEIRPASRGRWSARLDSGLEVQYPNPAEDLQQDIKALRAFLAEEFPGLHPDIHPLLVLTNPAVRLAGTDVMELQVAAVDSVADRVTAVAPTGNLLDEEQQQTLAYALCDRRLTSSQKAKAPFVFRSGGLLGSGKKVWTIRQAVQQMDRRPEDGAFHLRNGSLARWLEEQGAGHLAELARDVIRQRETDARVLVESFLLATGLVPRPRLRLWPRRVNLGCVLAGERATGRLWLRKQRGRGYLFGKLRTSEPWLRVEPTTFQGNRQAVIVSADAESLPISQTPWQAEILIDSSASDETIYLPVRLRVVGVPSPANRFFLRPMTGAVIAGALGMAIGWGLGQTGVRLPAWLAGALPAGTSAPVFLAAMIGFIWLCMGALRGLRQPLQWPLSQALARWLLRTFAWSAALAALALVAYGSWARLGPSGEGGVGTPELATVVLSALSLAVVPSTLAEIRSGRPSPVLTTQQVSRWRFVRRPARVVIVSLAILLIVIVAVPWLGRAWQDGQLEESAASAWDGITSGWNKVEVWIGNVMDRFNLRDQDGTITPAQGTGVATPSPTQGTGVATPLPTLAPTSVGTPQSQVP